MSARVSVFDTTLRDGEQSPGCSMTPDEKVRFARQLERLGVDVIEAGFPVASRAEQDAVRRVATEVRACSVAALARAKSEDIDVAARALEAAARPRLHVFLATSALHLEHKLKIRPAQALRQGSREFAGMEQRGMAGLVAAGFRPDYFAIRNAGDLSLPFASSRSLVVLAAGHLGKARLIDNVLVDLS
mgnify:CR=1 FL=1